MNIYEKIQTAKDTILKANLKKSGTNKFAGYSYYELADLLPTIIQVCNELKLFTAIDFTEDTAILRIVNSEKPEETMCYYSPMKEIEMKGCNPIQALGGVETYQRRYLYMAAFDIIENDMFDGAKPEENKPEPKADKKTIELIIELATKYCEMKKKGYPDELIQYYLKKYKANSLGDLTISQGIAICKELRSLIERQGAKQ